MKKGRISHRPGVGSWKSRTKHVEHEPGAEIYFLYRKIASATSATVMIHRTMFLLLLFSSAIKGTTTYQK